MVVVPAAFAEHSLQYFFPSHPSKEGLPAASTAHSCVHISAANNVVQNGNESLLYLVFTIRIEKKGEQKGGGTMRGVGTKGSGGLPGIHLPSPQLEQ